MIVADGKKPNCATTLCICERYVSPGGQRIVESAGELDGSAIRNRGHHRDQEWEFRLPEFVCVNSAIAGIQEHGVEGRSIRRKHLRECRWWNKTSVASLVFENEAAAGTMSRKVNSAALFIQQCPSDVVDRRGVTDDQLEASPASELQTFVDDPILFLEPKRVRSSWISEYGQYFLGHEIAPRLYELTSCSVLQRTQLFMAEFSWPCGYTKQWPPRTKKDRASPVGSRLHADLFEQCIPE
jgi:hypothetical protein